ncbi:SH3 domain-containing protein [Nioella nitratireducens]|uniref:SH3 domain-containing protein n=1 Tax=Nioella nitratireducens TaxID=1287720 RepID=UPI0018F3086F|nr:SH3 domain-containing protein [Nioella nitratireducens]
MTSMASAQVHDYPALYRVTGVASDDVLNVRSGPGVENRIVGALPPSATQVEIVGTTQDRGWGRVSLGEVSGWVSMRYLDRIGPDWNAGLPAPLYCHGTEPFWSYERAIGGGTFSSVAEPAPVPYAELWSGTPSGRGPQAFGIVLDSGTSTMTAIIRREICSDGMSDRDFGISGMFLRRTSQGTEVLEGCCALVR